MCKPNFFYHTTNIAQYKKTAVAKTPATASEKPKDTRGTKTQRSWPATPAIRGTQRPSTPRTTGATADSWRGWVTHTLSRMLLAELLLADSLAECTNLYCHWGPNMYLRNNFKLPETSGSSVMEPETLLISQERLAQYSKLSKSSVEWKPIKMDAWPTGNWKTGDGDQGDEWVDSGDPCCPTSTSTSWCSFLQQTKNSSQTHDPPQFLCRLLFWIIPWYVLQIPLYTSLTATSLSGSLELFLFFA